MGDNSDKFENRSGEELLRDISVLDDLLATSTMTPDAVEAISNRRDFLVTQFGKAALYAESLSREFGIEFHNPLVGILEVSGTSITTEQDIEKLDLEVNVQGEIYQEDENRTTLYLDTSNRVLVNRHGIIVQEYSPKVAIKHIVGSMELIIALKSKFKSGERFTVEDIDTVRRANTRASRAFMDNLIKRFPGVLHETYEDGIQYYYLEDINLQHIESMHEDDERTDRQRQEDDVLEVDRFHDPRDMHYNKDKVILDSYSRAEITLGERQYISILDNEEVAHINAVIATRIIQFLIQQARLAGERASNIQTITINALSEEIFWSLTYNEVALFQVPQDPFNVPRKKHSISKAYREAFKTCLMEYIGLMQYEYEDGTVVDFVNISDGTITWKINTISSAHVTLIPYDSDTEAPEFIEPLYTYATAATDGVLITDLEISRIRQIIDAKDECIRVTDVDAILCLDVVVSSNFRQTLSDNGIIITPLDRRKLYKIARKSMRPESFGSAIKARTMRGNLAAFGKGIHQRSGEIKPHQVTPFFGQVLKTVID